MSGRGWGVLCLAGIGLLGLYGVAQGVATVSSMGEMSSELVNTNETWMVEDFLDRDWSAWEAEVASGFEALADSAKSVPPTPIQLVTFLRQSVSELPALFGNCTNVIPSGEACGVPSWTIRVEERTDSNGKRYFLTLADDVVLHSQDVPTTFDPEAWSLSVYAPDGLPAWIANDPEERAEWFDLRERKRLGLEYLFLEPGEYDMYYANMAAEAESNRQKYEDTKNTPHPSTEFGVTAMERVGQVMTFSFYNPQGVDLDIVGASTLKNWPSPLVHLGRMATNGAHQVHFEMPMDPQEQGYFYQMLDASTDSDGDGIPDGLEVEYFETDPLRRDTAGHGADDWSMIYRFDLDARVADADGDGLPDGWEAMRGLNPKSIVGNDGADGDPDGDGILNRLEWLYGTHPKMTDSDEDGLADGDEAGFGTSPAHADSDGDGLPDGREFAYGTDPLKPNMDNDGIVDGDEVGYVMLVNGDSTDPFAQPIDTYKGYNHDGGTVDNVYNRILGFPFKVRLGHMSYTQMTVHGSTGEVTFEGSNLTKNLTLSLFKPLFPGDEPGEVNTTEIYAGGHNCKVIDFVNFKLRTGSETFAPGRLRLIVPDATSMTSGSPSAVDRRALRINYTFLQETAASLYVPVTLTYSRYAKKICADYTIPVGQTLVLHPGLGTDPLDADTDGDGLSDGDEVKWETDFRNPDTDDDGMCDGWEVEYGKKYGTHVFSPTIQNTDDTDIDGDTLSSYLEANYRTDPGKRDTDGDGADDDYEIEHNSDPNDPSDGGVENSRVAVTFEFGDPSKSKSEKYEVRLTLVGETEPKPIILRNEKFGEVQSIKAFLMPDSVYRVTMRHLATDPDCNMDCDYKLEIIPPSDKLVLIEDPDKLQDTNIRVEDGEPFPGEGKSILLYCFDASLVPDYDRDGTITTTDENLALAGRPLPMWWNTLGTVQDQEYPDENEYFVEGNSDIENFFPVRIRIGQLLRTYLAANENAYLQLQGDHLGALWCYGDMDWTSNFFSIERTGVEFGFCGDCERQSADVDPLAESGIDLPFEIMEGIRTGEYTDFLVFIEGLKESTTPLRLTLTDSKNKITAKDVCSLNLRIQDVESMYTTLNLRDTNSGENANENFVSPLLESTDDTVYFLHGYSVSESDADKWFKTIFKRLWQSGLNKNFCGVTWNGNDELLLPDYYKNVENAFVAAERLKTALQNKEGETILMAHSLGNMVVSSMLQDHLPADGTVSVSKYFMLNAAVPAEAYDDPPESRSFETNAVPKGLIHDAWRDYPAETWSAFWHRHFFPTDDFTPTEADIARSTLTWKGRFKDVLTNRGVTVYNYYSDGGSETSGDEVFELLNGTPDPTEGFEWSGEKGQYSWQKQECYKGRYTSFWTFAFAASDTMGWGFSADEETRSLAKKGDFSAEQYRVSPIFNQTPGEVLGNSATAIQTNRNHLLAYGIPAMTKAAGRSVLSKLDPVANEECQGYVQGSWGQDRSSALSGRWLHSDLKDMDYPYLRDFYKNIVERIHSK